MLTYKLLALNAANAALYTSNLPIKKSVCGVRVGKIDGEILINPTFEQLGKFNIRFICSWF